MLSKARSLHENAITPENKEETALSCLCEGLQVCESRGLLWCCSFLDTVHFLFWDKVSQRPGNHWSDKAGCLYLLALGHAWCFNMGSRGPNSSYTLYQPNQLPNLKTSFLIVGGRQSWCTPGDQRRVCGIQISHSTMWQVTLPAKTFYRPKTLIFKSHVLIFVFKSFTDIFY